MAAGEVQVAPDGAGKYIDAPALGSTDGANGFPTVYRQTVTVGDPQNYGNVARVTESGALIVTMMSGPSRALDEARYGSRGDLKGAHYSDELRG